MALEIKPRPCLGRIAAYVPGKSIASVEREFGLKRVVKLASNENPLGPSPKALNEFRKSAAKMFLYPEGRSPELREAVARFHDWDAAGVIVGNGSDEIIRLVCEAFLDPGDGAVFSQYAFLRFKQQALLMGAELREIPMKNWTHDLKAMAAGAQSGAKVAFIASPNNPTGTYNTEAELLEFLRSVPPSVVIILDEAYCQFAAARGDYPESLPDLVRRHPNLVVLRTLSKAYGLAGLRLGYGVGHPELIGWLDKIRMPFNVNLPAQKAAIAALADQAFVARSVALVRREGEKLARSLGDCGLDVVGASAANFLFVRSPLPGAVLFEALLRHGVIVRPLDEYGLSHHVRVSIGNSAQNRTLVSAVKKVLRGQLAALAA